VIDYQHVIVPSGFTEDTWVQAAEVRPTDRMVVHHIIAFVREPKSNWFRGQKPGVFFTAPQVKRKKSRIQARCPAIFWWDMRRGSAGDSSSRSGEIDQSRFGHYFSSALHAAWTCDARPIAVGNRVCEGAAEGTCSELFRLQTARSRFLGDPNYRVDSSFEVAPT